MADLHVRQNFTDEEIDIIKKHYPIGGASKVREFLPNRSAETIRQKARKLGVNGSVKRFTPEEDDIIRKHYPQNGWSEVQKYINRSQKSIQQRAFQLGVKYLEYNERYFKKIDTPTKAYWLGFVYTDGYVTETRKRFGIELAIVDKSHLQNLLNDMESNLVIRTRIRENKEIEGVLVKKMESCSILFANARLYDDLYNLGVKPDKSKNVTFPSYDIVPKEYMSHFIRGLFDGNGSIGLQKNREYMKPSISIVSGSEKFTVGLKEELLRHGISINLTKSKDKDLWKLRTEKQGTCHDLLKFLYKNSEDKNRLYRKYVSSSEICEYYKWYGLL